jgi:hypothetical protein
MKAPPLKSFLPTPPLPHTKRPDWLPVREPWTTTAARTVGLAVFIGAGIGLVTRQMGAIPANTAVALWFTLGGHFVELAYRNQLGRSIAAGAARVVTRIAWWLAGGVLLGAGAQVTWTAFTGDGAVPWPWWAAGVGFVGAELLVHLVMLLRGLPNFYRGNG